MDETRDMLLIVRFSGYQELPAPDRIGSIWECEITQGVLVSGCFHFSCTKERKERQWADKQVSRP